MIILKTIYFKGELENPFPVEQTRTDVVYSPDGSTYVKYMITIA